jgi:DNA replication and repair protein RecF
MLLTSISLQNFRSYKKSEFNFSKTTTLVIGPNTAGKSNLIEAIFLLAKGASFRIDRDEQMVKFDEDIARIKGQTDQKNLEVMIARGGIGGTLRPVKKYLVNKVPKRKNDFVGNFFAVLFAPNDLEIIIGSPSRRRDFIDNILIQTDRDYRLALGFYEKGLRIRNALLHKVRETGRRQEKEFEYWDNLLIHQGERITLKREEFITYLNDAKKDIFNFKIFYDKSTISKERLFQYKDAEVASGVTLVGPHRDDLIINYNEKDVRFFGSRGQQRLAILQLKILELDYIKEKIQEEPVLLLDDIFSELDEGHIKHVLDMLENKQVIMTTTHEEFVPKKLLKRLSVIELRSKNARV